MAEVLRKFGRYFLLDLIAQGGMAEIYRARMASRDGAGRLIVIKRIQAGYGTNSEFLQMFKSEIKVTMGFNHPNIVQLYDFGDEQEQPYIAMEFVDGKNLRQFLQRFSELKQTFPVDLAAFIIEQAASGLHYAHAYRDKITGEPVNIIHRDISPQNVLISYEGSVKIIDFGIAKANSNSETTRAGVIKGKPSYLSPEQINGDPLDCRCDLFALGTVLWELLTGKKLFSGENDLAVLKLIESSSSHVKPPSTLNPQVPQSLDTIVMRTLSRNREKRFQTAEELQRALHKFLYSFNPDFNPRDLSYYAKDLFKNEIVEDRKLIQRLNDKVEVLLAVDDPVSSPLGIASGGKKKDDTTTVVDSRGAQPANQQLFDAGSIANLEIDTQSARPGNGFQSPRPSAPSAKPNRSRSISRAHPVPLDGGSPNKGMMFAAAAAALVGVIFFGKDFGLPVPDFFAGETKLILKGDAKHVVIAVNGQKLSVNMLPATIHNVTPGAQFKVSITGEGGTWEKSISVAQGQTSEEQVVLKPDSASTSGHSPASIGKSLFLKLNVIPGTAGALVQLNGKPIDPENASISVELDRPQELTIARPGFKPYRQDFTLDSRTLGSRRDYEMEIRLDPVKFGLLTIRTTPSADAQIMMDGKPWERKTPIENEKFPVGTYNIRLHNDALGMEKTVTVTIQDGKSTIESVRLAIKD